MEQIQVAVLVHLILFGIATVLVVRSKLVEKRRKWYQILFSLLLPFVGPLITILIHTADTAKPGLISDRYYGQSIDEAPLDVKLYHLSHHDD